MTVAIPTALIKYGPSQDPSGDATHLVGRLFFNQFPQSFVLTNKGHGVLEAGHTFTPSLGKAGDRVKVSIASQGEIPEGDLETVSGWIETFLNDHGLVTPGFAGTITWEVKQGEEYEGTARRVATALIDPSALNQNALACGLVYSTLSRVLSSFWPVSAKLGAPPSYDFNWGTGDLSLQIAMLTNLDREDRCPVPPNVNGPLYRIGEEVRSADLSRILSAYTNTLELLQNRLRVISGILKAAGIIEEGEENLLFHVNPWLNDGCPVLVAKCPAPGLSVEQAAGIVSTVEHIKHQYVAAGALANGLLGFIERRMPQTLLFMEDIQQPLAHVEVTDSDGFKPPRLKLSSNSGELHRISQILTDASIAYTQDPFNNDILWIDKLNQDPLVQAVAQAFAPIEEAFRS